MAEVESRATPLVDQGDIYFLYRPRVEADRVRGLDDVQRVYLLLRPKGARKYRLLIVGRKRLPDPSRHDRFWAFVYKVFRSRAALGEELGEVRYRTKTRGLRDEPEARPVAEGVYALVRHGDHTHLTYVLELPERPRPGRARPEHSPPGQLRHCREEPGGRKPAGRRPRSGARGPFSPGPAKAVQGASVHPRRDRQLPGSSGRRAHAHRGVRGSAEGVRPGVQARPRNRAHGRRSEGPGTARETARRSLFQGQWA